MSLQTIPTELFLLILNLPDNDKYTLNITSRVLRDRMPLGAADYVRWSELKLPPHERRHGRFWGEAKSLLDFRTRLTRPGNVFADKDIALCAYCIRFRPSSKFPIKDMLLNGLQACEYCIVHVLRDAMTPGKDVQTYKGVDYKLCDDCRDHVEVKDIEAHDSSFNSVRHLCSRCHLDCCREEHCLGWTVDDVVQNFGHFFYGDWENQQGMFQPKHCDKCQEVERLRQHWKKERYSVPAENYSPRQDSGGYYSPPQDSSAETPSDALVDSPDY